MPLQIRRGNTAEVNSITPLTGELIYDTQLGRVLVGDGATAGGVPLTGVTSNEAKDAAAQSILAGTHRNINFTYDSVTKALSAEVDILLHNTIEADAIVTGKIFNSSSSVILNVDTGVLNGNVNGNVTGNLTGNVSGNVTGVLNGLAGSTILGSVTGSFTGSVNATAGSVLIGNTTGFHTGDVKGSLFADDSSLLIDAVDSRINTDGTVGTVRPAANNQFDLGSNATRFKDLYLNNSLRIGSAIMIASGTGFDLPAASTIGGQSFGFRVGADDSSNTPITQGQQLRILGDNTNIITYVDGGNIVVSGNVGSLRATTQAGESSIHYIPFLGSLNTLTTVRTDGNLRYTPSTATIDFLTGTINATTFNAPSVNTTNLRSQSLSTGPTILKLWSEWNSGTVDQYLVSVGDGQDITKSSRFQVVTNQYWGSFSLATFTQHHSTADASNVQFARSRGTSVTPAVVQSGDDIADLAFSGFDGSTYQTRAVISATVNGAVSAGVVPMRIDIGTSTNGSGAPVTAVSINQNQQTTFSGAITLKSYADATARDTAITSPAAGMMVFNTALQKFQGYVSDTGLAGGGPSNSTPGWIDLN